MTSLPCTGGVVAVAGLLMADASEFASFMHLKMVVCVGIDGLDDVFGCMTFWGWCGSYDGDICTDGGVGAAVVVISTGV